MGLEASGLSNLFLEASGVQAAAGAASSYAQARAQRAEGRYLKQTADEDAAMRELEAKEAERQGGRAAALKGKETQAMLSTQRVIAGRQGSSSDQSALDIMGDTAMFGAMDRETINNNTWRSAWGLRAEATQTRRAGRNARDASRFGSQMTAATGGLQFGRDALQGAYGAAQFRDPAPTSREDAVSSYSKAAVNKAVKKASSSAAKNAAKNAGRRY